MKKNVFYILRLSLTLLIITSAVAALLALVNLITAPVIAQSKEEKLRQAIETVLPGGGESVPFTDTTGLVQNLYASPTGYAAEVTPSGFDGQITMMVGMDTEGRVTAIEIISHTETAGLGAVAAADNAKGNAFRNQFAGMSGSLAVTKDGGTVDAISGATITSRAVTEGVNAALACVAAQN